MENVILNRSVMLGMAIVVFSLFDLAHAGSNSTAGAWNDFTNNFASDIAPLITLFGEQVTKQFLSESTGFLDNIIFGMAPLGILTAIVSAIRIYGWPGLKAFVGRAQEPHGVAEAELCSSTSRDVCELWSEGGICRVFGRPKVLEFFYKPGKEDFYPKFSTSTTEKEIEEPGTCNLYRPVCFLVGNRCCRKDGSQQGHDQKAPVPDRGCDEKDSEWREESKTSSANNGESNFNAENGDEDMTFAPYPNLSLNIGIRATPHWVLSLVAIFGSLVQLSFFGYGTVITFYSPELYGDGKTLKTWAFVLAVLGTAMVVTGMILCAFLVERKSRERRFADDGHVANKNAKADTTMYWLQPGNQRVGDQQFNAFAHKKVKHTYITSWKTDQGRDQLSLHYVNLILVLALCSSAAGFILQFTGLRSLHGSVALYQIAATLLMSIVRALLRLRRLDPSDNNLRTIGTKVEGHELDWQAIDIFTDHPGRWNELSKDGGFNSSMSNLSGFHLPLQIKAVKSWRVCDEKSWSSGKHFCSNQNSVEQMVSKSRYGELFGFRNNSNRTLLEDTDTWPASLVCATEAVHVASRYEGAFRVGVVEYLGPNPVAMIALLRSRLAYLTGDGIIGVQPKWDGPSRSVAQELQLAMQGVANYIFSGHMTLKGNWQDILALTWHTTAMIGYTLSGTTDEQDTKALGPLWISFPMFRYGREWKISKHRLEAVISLWASSLDRADASDDLNDKVLLITDAEKQSIYSTLKLWMPAENLKLLVVGGSPTWTEAWLAQGRRLLLREQAERDGTFGHNWHITMRAKSSRVRLLAQTIFTIFISRLADIIDTIDIREDDLFSAWELPHAESQTISSSERFHRLSNTHIKSITKLFVQSGLGTEEEALMCIIPVFLQASILPQEDTIMDKLLRRARKLRRGKQFLRAEVILKIMLDNAKPVTRQTALREIGEVYRKAYRAHLKDWALDGLKQMSLFMEVTASPEKEFHTADSAMLKGWPKPYHPTTNELAIFKRYRDLADSLQEHRQTGLSRESLRDLLKLQLDSSSDDSTEVLTRAMRVELSTLGDDEAGNLLLLSIRNSCPELVDDLLENKHGLISSMIASGWTLDEAMKPKVDILVMETILDLGEIPIDSPYNNRTGDTALSLATRERRADIVRLLLNRGVPVNAPTPTGAAIFYCVADKDGKALSPEDTQEFMTLLLDKGATVDAQFDNSTLVKRACVVGNHRAVRILVERGADLRNQMLLNEAARRGDTAILQTLLDAALDSEINKSASNDLVPHPVLFIMDSPLPGELALLFSVMSTDGAALHTAVEANQTEMAEILLKRSDCNLNMQIDGDLGYAIIIACFLGYDRIVDMLLAAEPPVDVNVVGKVGSALAIACARAAADMARKLLNRGARVKEPGGKLGSPLVVACLQGCEGIVEELLRKESTDQDHLGVGGLTALCAAVKSSNYKIVQMLIEHRADVDLPGTQGTTPLLIAVSTKFVDTDIVKALLEAGADPNKRGGEEAGNLAPLEMCYEQGNDQEVVEALKRAGAHDTETPSAELKRWRSRKERLARENEARERQANHVMSGSVTIGSTFVYNHMVSGSYHGYVNALPMQLVLKDL